MLIIGTEWVNKQFEDLAYNSVILFNPEWPSQVSINMVKVLSTSFEQCFDPFTILLVKGSFETGLFRRLSKHVFRSP